MAQAFCLRKVLFFSSRDSSRPEIFTHLFFFFSFFLLFSKHVFVIPCDKEPNKRFTFTKKKKKANTPVIYKDPVVMITMLLSTLTKNMFAACQQRRKEKKKKKQERKERNFGTKTTCAAVNSGLSKHEGICSDPQITELKLQKKSWLMESLMITQHVVKALTA